MFHVRLVLSVTYMKMTRSTTLSPVCTFSPDHVVYRHIRDMEGLGLMSCWGYGWCSLHRECGIAHVISICPAPFRLFDGMMLRVTDGP